MDKIIINGGNPLEGHVQISGAKNAVLPVMAACIMAPGEYILNNVPSLRDTRTMAKLLESIGAKVEHSGSRMTIDTRHCNNPVAPYEIVKTMRASFDILGALISRFNRAEVSLPGGCAWGPRPVNYHLTALEKLGIHIDLDQGNILAQGKLSGAEIDFEFPSVGATKNALMAAVTAKGESVIRNVAREPEIDTLVDFLTKMGAKIDGKGTSELRVIGVDSLHGDFEFDIIPDRIEAGTFLIGVALAGGAVTLHRIIPRHLSIVISKLRDTGADVVIEGDSIRITAPQTIRSVNVTTAPYPGFPTDLQAQWMALMSKGNKTAVIIDEIYHDRFTHVAELGRLGAKITLDKNVAAVEGVKELFGAPVMSTDIRASASLILAAIAAKGRSEISRVYHIDRGYENIENKFRNLGVDIRRERG